MNLALSDGWHAGPLFVPQIIRTPKPAMRGSHRERSVQLRTPKWADKRRIRTMKAMAHRLSVWTGERYERDHIVPLHSEIVCGLHVEWNLRIIHWLENAKKGANWWPDMPFCQLNLFGEN